MKERLTITLDNKVLKKVENWSKREGISNRSSAIEILLKKSFGLGIEKAIILAGGKGVVGSLTQKIPKPMIVVKNKPILEWQVELMKKFGISDIIISVGYMAEKIKEYFGDGSNWGVNINYIEEEKPLGTAGPLRKIKHLIKSRFLMLYGDNLFDIDIDDIVNFHEKNNGKMTVAIKTLPKAERYGNVQMSGNRIVDFKEKPKNTISNLVSSGFFVLEPEVIDYCENAFSFEREVVPKVVKDGSAYGYVFAGKWYDIESEESYKKASKEWNGIGGDI
jgi:NDP-sugar pyrophosphorylase family protein